jgi:rod shape-determining protein MreC
MNVRLFLLIIAAVLGANVFSAAVEKGMVTFLGWLPAFHTPSPLQVIPCLRTPHERSALRPSLDIDDRFTSLAGRIIGEPPDHLLQRFIVNVGFRSGVRGGDAVVDSRGIYVGRVLEARPNSSVVAFVASELQNVTVRIVPTSDDKIGYPQMRPLGILRGRGRASARIEYLDKNAAIASGATVVTSERETTIPPDILVGTIDRVELDETGMFQRATISLPVNFNDLENVVILRVNDAP